MTTTVFAQGIYGNTEEDSIECIKNISLYRESYTKLKDYDSAFTFCEKAASLCPNSINRLFNDGVDIIHHLIELNSKKSKQKELITKLLWFYDKWIERDGELQEILILKEEDLKKYKKIIKKL